MPTIDRHGDFVAAFPALHRRAYQAAYRLVGDRSVAEELAQEALTRAYVHWPRLDARREGWVVTTTVNLAIDHGRRSARRATRDATTSAADPDVALRVDLQRLLAALPRRQREVAVLRYLEDRSESDVAALLGCSVGSVKRHASRAAAHLRSVLPSLDAETT